MPIVMRRAKGPYTVGVDMLEIVQAGQEIYASVLDANEDVGYFQQNRIYVTHRLTLFILFLLEDGDEHDLGA